MRSRLAIVRVAPQAGAGLLTSGLVVAVVLGLLPVGFILATSVMIGRVPDAVTGGIGSAEWTGLITAFGLAAGAFLLQQLFAPLQTALGELLKRRVDGRLLDRLVSTALGAPGIAPLEDQELLDDLAEARDDFETNWNTPVARSLAWSRSRPATCNCWAWSSSSASPSPGGRGCSSPW